MTKTRDNYHVTGSTPAEIVRSLNFLLARLADRMDKIEGIRGQPSIEANLTMNNSVIENVGVGEVNSDAARLDDIDDFASLIEDEIVIGEWQFTEDTSFNGNVYVFDDDGYLIHSLE